MPDFSEFKVPVYEGINDVPKEPTATEPGNGSDLIARFNALCDFLSENLADVATSGEYQDLNNLPAQQSNLVIEVENNGYENTRRLVIEGEGITGYGEEGILTITFPSSSSDGGSGYGGGY